jgi:hypothetical protein
LISARGTRAMLYTAGPVVHTKNKSPGGAKLRQNEEGNGFFFPAGSSGMKT